ncbi:hypothetical protein JK635_05835 [Neobacillus sp. YIM B02564]|uniref:Uncharacterized protein n=2 Tax=Neobacillus TaxID=2675232 RepID=A0ABS1TKB7_9BACI|nr:hypothetical protein [Neobacillus paridis]MBL4951759.1 hypothetical protein [Neobacillus paridis]
MEKEDSKKNPDIAAFSEIVKKAYDKGRNETELTLEQLMEDLKADLRNLLIGSSTTHIDGFYF